MLPENAHGLEMLLDQLDCVIQTPADVEKLEQTILQLAVQGKLVPQRQGDEAATALLARNIAERKRLEKKKEIRRLKNLPPIESDEIPYDLPPTWTWCRLGEVTDYGISDKVGPEDIETGTWVLGLADIEPTTSRLLQKERFGDVTFKSTKNVFHADDVLYGKLRPYLDKVIVADEDGVCTTEIIPLQGYVDIDPYYLRLCLKRPDFIEYANQNTYGMNLPRLKTQDARMALVPLAPLEEQKRIVAKVDELFAQTQRLKTQLAQTAASRTMLQKAAVRRLASAETPAQRSDAWHLIAGHFDTLYDAPAHVDDLKQTILQLAVQGKLVPQDPEEEPASVLLERIAAEKQRLIREKQIRRARKLPSISREEMPFELPENWEWTRLGDLCYLITDGTHYTPTYVESGVPFLSVKDISGGFIDFSDTKFITPEEHAELIERCSPEYGDILLTKVGTTGIAKVVDTHREFSIFVSVALLKFDQEEILSEYLEHLINSPLVREKSANNTRGVGNQNLVLRDIKNFTVPIPPLREQHRIVAKVDELLTLCDRLAEEVTAARTTRERLLEALLAKAN